MASPSRPTDLPKFTNDTSYFSFGCKNIRDCILFLVFLVNFSWWNYHLFRTFATDRKQVDFGRETAVFPLVPIQEKRVAKRAVLGLKNKRKMAFLPFKRQFFYFQAVRYAASVSNTTSWLSYIYKTTHLTRNRLRISTTPQWEMQTPIEAIYYAWMSTSKRLEWKKSNWVNLA